MKKTLTKFLSALMLLATTASYAQNVGINTPAPDASAALDVVSADRGILIPRIALNATNLTAPVAAPATSLLVYNTATSGAGATAVTPGYYYWDGGRWVRLATGGGNTLDQAYDEGGAGAGRIITADAGTVEINGAGGLSVTSSTTTSSNSAYIENTDGGTQSSWVELGHVNVGGVNNNIRGVRGVARITASTSNFDGAYGVLGGVGHPSNGTVDLSSGGGNQNNKAIGVGGSINSRSSYTGTERDALAAVYGGTGSHNSSGGTVSGGVKLYAGLFAGNGRTLGLWGENSTFIEFMPRSQQLDFDAAVVGFFNSAANGGNNGASTGTADSYFSIEANVTDATAKDLILQNRTTGDVGINTAAPTARLSVNGNANKTGGTLWAAFSDARLKKNISDYTEGLDLITQVRTVNFEYNQKMVELWGDDPSLDKTYQGVIAQELQEIAPDMVREVSVEIHDEDNDPSNNSEEKYLEVDPSKFLYALINAVKEQQAQIEDLKKENEAMKAEIKELAK